MRSIVILVLLVFLMAACQPAYNTTKVVKPKKHFFTYNPKWHKNAKRVHRVTYKN